MSRLSRFDRRNRTRRSSCWAGSTTSPRLDELRRTFDQSLGRCDHLIVDLSAAEFIDSTTIRVLMEAREHAAELDRKFNVVLGTAPIVERVLEISGILPL